MKKTKLVTKITLLSILVISVFSVIPTVQGTSSVRPIEDWMVNNPSNGNMADPENDLFMWVDFPWYTYEYEGFILERVLKDGSLMITVHLYVMDIFVVVSHLPNEELIFTGYVDYEMHFKFILHKNIPGNGLYYDPNTGMQIWQEPDTRGPGAELPYWFPIIFYGTAYWFTGQPWPWTTYDYGSKVIGAEPISHHLIASGSGWVYDNEYGYTPGPATITVHQLSLVKQNKPPIVLPQPWYGEMYSDLNYYPIEFIKIES